MSPFQGGLWGIPGVSPFRDILWGSWGCPHFGGAVRIMGVSPFQVGCGGPGGVPVSGGLWGDPRGSPSALVPSRPLGGAVGEGLVLAPPMDTPTAPYMGMGRLGVFHDHAPSPVATPLVLPASQRRRGENLGYLEYLGSCSTPGAPRGSSTCCSPSSPPPAPVVTTEGATEPPSPSSSSSQIPNGSQIPSHGSQMPWIPSLYSIPWIPRRTDLLGGHTKLMDGHVDCFRIFQDFFPNIFPRNRWDFGRFGVF